MISLARYSALLSQPALRSAILASMLGRLPIGITGLAILMLAQQTTDSFAAGGAIAACYVAGLAALAPLLGRLIDRYGPRPTLLACAMAFPSALAALVAALSVFAPLWFAFLLAAIAGACFPPITVCMRTFFKQRLKEDALLGAAYSLESVLIELIFILGPVLVAVFVALATPAVAVLFAAACGCLGTFLFQRSEALRQWRIEPRGGASLLGPLAQPGFLPLLAVIVCYASAFGLVEIGTIAFATEAGRPALAGVLLGIMSIGSAAGGLVYGSRSWRMPLARQFPVMFGLDGSGRRATRAVGLHMDICALVPRRRHRNGTRANHAVHAGGGKLIAGTLDRSIHMVDHEPACRRRSGADARRDFDRARPIACGIRGGGRVIDGGRLAGVAAG